MPPTSSSQVAAPACQVINAPDRPEQTEKTSLFLSGNANNDWREQLCNELSDLPITIYNPYRKDWGKDWKEDLCDNRFKKQVEWEMDMMDKADLIAYCFWPGTDAPVSLLELGLHAQSGKAIVMCSPGDTGFGKRGNVQAVCEKWNIVMVETMEQLQAAIRDRV